MDREKVIKGLECCKNKTMLWQHDQCPYHGFDEDCESNLHADALALLNEQDQKIGHWTTKRTLQHDGEWYCDQCEYEPTVFENTSFCPNCGAKREGR